MKKIIYLVVLQLAYLTQVNAQLFMTTTANVQFFSETPVQNISAVNSKVSTLINTNTDSVLVRMRNTDFVFTNSLMQEHFNENYMESTKYPFDEFYGKINPVINYARDGVYKVSATGNLTIHGTTKPASINGTLSIKNGNVHLDAEFMIHTADFNIEVPKLVFEKIAQDIKVDMSADYKLVKK